jgi:hypothetical protein
MRLIVMFGLVVAAFVGHADSVQAPAEAASASSSLLSGRCGKWAVPARIGGKAVCLRENQTCKARFAPHYRRLGFRCFGGVLVLPWSYLRSRPLQQQVLDSGAPCPVTKQTGRVGGHPGLGPGPAYPIGTHALVTMPMPPPDGWGSEWSGTKRVWLVDPRYTGRILVRGRQLDGPNEVRFVNGRGGFTPEKRLNPISEFRIEWAGDYPSLTRLRAPGCYAYQVEGRTFSYRVIFQAQVDDTG